MGPFRRGRRQSTDAGRAALRPAAASPVEGRDPDASLQGAPFDASQAAAAAGLTFEHAAASDGEASADGAGPAGAAAAGAAADEAAADEAAADAARGRYRLGIVDTAEPDTTIRGLLEPGEELMAVRRGGALDRRQTGLVMPAGLPGDVYLTSTRLVHLADRCQAYDLDAIEETALSGDRLILLMRDGTCVTLTVDRPRLLRVQIAAARARRRTGSLGVPVMSDETAIGNDRHSSDR